MPLEIVRNDITLMEVDAIVNTANPRPVVGGGVDYAIHQRAGAGLLAARQKIGAIATGAAFITDAFALPARYVIHTVGPVWRGGSKGERALLRDCYLHSLQLAAEHGCTSVAFPLISAGIFGCPAEIAIATAVDAIRSFLQQQDMEVYLVVFDRKSFQLSGSLFQEVADFLDENYVAQAMVEEYQIDGNLPYPGRRRQEAALDAVPAEGRALAHLLDEVEDTFSESLLRLIVSRGRTESEVYKRANVDRKLFSKIRNNPAYQPSKATALAFAVALELNLDETRDFIGRAGYALSPSSKADIILEYFIRRGEYDIFIINETLFAFAQPTLGC